VSAIRDCVQNDHDHNPQDNSRNSDELWTWRKLVTETSCESIDSQLNPALSDYEALIQVKTAAEGFNSGRIYYIHANSENHREQLVQELTKAAAKAVAKKLAASRFRSSQNFVRTVYESAQCQILVGILIMTVSTLPPI
jgi:hypothetical protein